MSEQLRSGTAPRMASLTGIRYPTLFLVFLSHVAIIIPFANPDTAEKYGHYLGWVGQIGVSLFYLLSGFVLAWAPRAKDSPLSFWRRRIVRIAPLHWVTFGVAMAVFASSVITTKGAIMNLLMVQAWSSDPEIFGSANAPSWSLACLLLFYLIFPVLYRVIARIKPQHLWFFAAGVVVAIVAVTAVVRAVVPNQAGMAPQAPAGSLRAYWIIQIFPVTRVLDFVLGILMARIVRTGRWIGVRPLPLAVLLVISYLASMEAPREYRLVATMIVPLALFIASLAAADTKGRKTVFAVRPLQWLGDISYAFLLIHWPVMNFVFKSFGQERLYSGPFAVGVVAIDLTVSIALAWLLTIAVEKPLVRYLSVSRKSAAAERAAALEPVEHVGGTRTTAGKVLS